MKLDTETRQKQIIEISLDIIRKGGIQKLTINEISKQIGISEQAIYRHFDSKLHIITSIIQYFDLCFKELFETLDMPQNSLDQIRMLTSSHLEFFKNNPAIAAVIFSEEIFQNKKTLISAVHDILNKRLDHVTKFILEGQNNGEIKKEFDTANLAHILLASLRLMVTRWRLSDFSFDIVEKGTGIVEDFITLIKESDIINEN